MKKPSKPKPTPTPPDFLPACHRLGKAVRFSFLRIIKKAHECSDGEAIQIFDRAVKAGKIVQDGTNAAGDVEIYLAK